MKKELLFALLSLLLLPLGLKAYDIPDNGGSFVVDNGVVTFSNTSAGKISANSGSIISYFNGATRIQFDHTCAINKADLECFLQGNTYYVDLFDITNGTNTPMKVDDKTTPDDDNDPYNIDKIILEAVDDMAANNWAAKGIILPYNSTVGTSNVIKHSMEQWTQYPSWSCTFNEYAAYYRESGTAKNLVIHVWDHYYWAHPNWGRNASDNYTNAIIHIGVHNEKINYAQTALVSTISDVKFDLSGLAAPIKIEITGDNMIQDAVPGNQNIPDKADIYVNSTTADDLFAGHIQTTGTKNTPTNLLHLTGVFSAADIAAVNQFTPWDQTVNPYHGPRVLDLSNVTTPISVDILNSLANKDIEYIILPPGVSKDVVLKADYSDLDKLKAVVSSSSTDLVAYVKVPGSLAEARMLVTGKDDGYYYIPTTVDFKNVSLGGNLNAADICAKTTVNNSGLAGITTIESIDLTYAVFANNEDMNFQTAGLIDNDNPFTEIILPKSLETIPDHCFQKLPQSLTHICIPYNVKHIGERAFDETYINHITTTDAKGAEIDNGVGTYTFSANLKSIKTGAFRPVNGVDYSVFISDIYVLATEVPLCENSAFRENLTFGYWSYGHEGVYCRDHYPITVLHFPSQPQGMSDDDYKAMQKKYTDIDKVYTKKDQTGAVDVNGNPLLWPTWAEINRVYNQATWTVNGNRVGVTWTQWNVEYSQYNGVNWEPASDISQPDVCSFAGYEGWHEFVLTMASYVPPTEEIADERNYVEDRWYTFCIPFDMTEDEVIKLLGVPKTEVDNEGKVTGDIIYKCDGEMVTVAKMPKIHTLKSINRELNGSRGIITLFMSEDLAVKKDVNGNYTYFIPSQDISTEGTYAPNVPNTKDQRREPIVIRGGYPYLIKPYRRTNETITNLGLSVLNRYAFSSVASSVYREGCYIKLGGEHSIDPDKYPAYKSPFAVPYEGHVVQAAFFKTGGEPTKAQYKDGEDMKDYKYRFMGQYWQQPLPLNSYYISSKGNWNYYQTEHEGWYWKPYNCVINVGSELDVAKTTYFKEVGMDEQGGAVFEGQLHLEYKGGHNDSFVVNENQAARSIRIVFDEAIQEYDSEGNVMTAIESIDGQDLAPFSPCKVYDMKGQYVGSSLDGLQKGIYIVKGKKVVVD